MILDIHELREAVKAAGSHFFDADSMRFFDSRILPGVWNAADGSAYFVTSERFRGSGGYIGPRLFSVRRWANGTVDTVGKFQAHKTAGQAKREAARLAQASA